jgi:hypothetical protein
MLDVISGRPTKLTFLLFMLNSLQAESRSGAKRAFRWNATIFKLPQCNLGLIMLRLRV